MAWRCRFMSASEVPKSTQKLVQPVVVAGLHRASAGHPAGSLRSTETTDDDKLRRGASTDLMGEVGDAFVAPRVVPVAGGGSPCGHHVGFGEDDLPPPSPAFPEHPAIFLASGFCCAPRISFLRSERTKSPWHLKQLGARGMLVKVGVNRLLRSQHGDHMVTFPPATGTASGATNASPTSPVRSVAAPRRASTCHRPLFRSIVRIQRGVGRRLDEARRRRQAAPTSEYFSVLRSRS